MSHDFSSKCLEFFSHQICSLSWLSFFWRNQKWTWIFKFFLFNLRLKETQSVIITKNKVRDSTASSTFTSKIYFVKSELFTPACSHFLITGLRNDIGRAVKTANETTNIKSVVKWFIPKSVPESHSQGKAEANKVFSIGTIQVNRDYASHVTNNSFLSKNYQSFLDRGFC